MAIDALTLVSKVIDRTAQKCGQLVPSTAVALDDDQRTEMIVEMLASQVFNFLGVGASSDAPSQQGAEAVDLEQICADQVRRNRRLARALGACDCWGELRSCDLCGGRGIPGWRRPDMATFDHLVRPVVRRLEQQRARTPRSRVNQTEIPG